MMLILKGKLHKKTYRTKRRESDTARIENEREFKEFVDTIRSESSKKYYVFVLKRYMRAQGFTSCKQLVKNRNVKAITADIVSYMDNQKSISNNTLQTYLAVLKHFYEMNDIVGINWKKLKRRLGNIEKKNQDRAYEVKEIQLILNSCDIRAKTVILLLASSGMRIGALAGLKIRHLTKVENLYKILVYEGTREQYTTFCTPECASTIDDYLAYRQRFGETITPDSPVIREQFDITDREAAKVAKPASDKRLTKIVHAAVVKAGLRKVVSIENKNYGTVRHEVHLAHGFRKFFNTVLVQSDISPIVVEALMGHKAGLQKNYLRMTDQELLKAYKKAINGLTINESERLQKQVITLEQAIKEKEGLEARLSRVERLAEILLTEEMIEKLNQSGKKIDMKQVQQEAKEELKNGLQVIQEIYESKI